MRPIKPVHTTKNHLRWRLEPPEAFDHFATKTIPGGIRLILGYGF